MFFVDKGRYVCIKDVEGGWKTPESIHKDV